MREEWKPIDGYEGIYEVSSLGRVRNKYGRILSQCKKQNTDYMRVHLAKNNTARWFSVHRLVAIAFLPMKDGKDTVNHLDHDKTNNCVDNLEWCSLKENCAYAAQEGRYKVPYDNLKKGLALLKKGVIGTSSDGTEYVFESLAQAHRVTGASRASIAGCCQGKYGFRTAAGYKWRFA